MQLEGTLTIFIAHGFTIAPPKQSFPALAPSPAISAPTILLNHCAAWAPVALGGFESRTAWSAIVVYSTNGRWKYVAVPNTCRRSLEPAEADAFHVGYTGEPI